MIENAVLLTAAEPSGEDGKAAKVLELFGVPCRRSRPAAVLMPAGAAGAPAGLRLLCSADAFLLLLRDIEDRGGQGLWSSTIHSAFVYPGTTPGALEAVTSAVTKTRCAAIRPLDPSAGPITVTRDLDELAGVMSGVQVTASAEHVARSPALVVPEGAARPVISTAGGPVFLRAEHLGVPVFLSTCEALVDIDEEVPGRQFDIRDHFLAAVPIVLYVKWAFAGTA